MKSIHDMPFSTRSNAVSDGYVAPCTYSRILSAVYSETPSGCLLRTYSRMPGSTAGTMNSSIVTRRASAARAAPPSASRSGATHSDRIDFIDDLLLGVQEDDGF